MDIYDAIIELIKKHRKAQGMTQTQLAEKMGLSLSTIGRYETGATPLTPDVIDKFSEALGVSLGNEAFNIVADNFDFGDIALKYACSRSGYTLTETFDYDREPPKRLFIIRSDTDRFESYTFESDIFEEELYKQFSDDVISDFQSFLFKFIKRNSAK